MILKHALLPVRPGLEDPEGNRFCVVDAHGDDSASDAAGSDASASDASASDAVGE